MVAEVRLGDHCSVQSSKRVFAREYVEQGVPFFRSKDVIDKALGSFTGYDLFISEERFRQLKAQTGCPQKGDLLINSVGNRTGQSYIVGDEGDFYFKDGNILWLDKFNGIDPHWLSYWMKSKGGQEALASIMIGSAQKALTIDGLRKLWLRLPSLEEQSGAAALLCCLDDKIELNRRMNETLEEMARALFRDWFFDFGPTRRQMEGTTDACAIMGQAFPPEKAATLAPLFPAKLGDDGLPEGWRRGTAADHIDFNPKEPLKKGTIAPYSDMASLPTSGSLIAPPVDRDFKSGMRFRNGDALIARITPCLENGKAGFVDYLTDEAPVGWGSTEFFVLRSKPYVAPQFAYCLVRDPDFRKRAEQSMTGTSGRQRAQIEVLMSHELTVPSKSVHREFGAITTPFFEKIKANGEENRTLAEMRDLLLPKLMSGEIRLKDVEAAL